MRRISRCQTVLPDGFDDVPRETMEQLERLVCLVVSWNPTIRLVASAQPDEIWRRHVQDSLQLRRFFPPDVGNAADVGSGAGFPGLVLAIAMKRHFHLIEADQRKAAFLIEAARITNADVTVMPQRAKAIRMNCDLLTARAFATVTDILSATFYLLAPRAVCLLPKGRSVARELETAQRNWCMTVEKFASETDPDACILRLSGISRA